MSDRGLIPFRGKKAFTLWLAQHVTHAAVGRANWPDAFNPPIENYAATPAAWKATNYTLVAIVAASIVQDGVTAIANGLYNLTVDAGTSAGTLKLTYNAGAAVDNVAPNTVAVQLHGGAAGTITVNVGALPGTLPQTDSVTVAFGLDNEIGRMAVTAINYLIPDPLGTIIFDGDPATYRYALPGEIAAALADPQGPLAPSADVEFTFEIPANTITGEVICQIGLFANAVTPGPGFTPLTQVSQVGEPVYLVNFPADSIYANKVFNRRIRVDASN